MQFAAAEGFLINYKMETENTNFIDAFIDALNSIFWDGYAEQLAKENPQAYTQEFNQFCENFS